MTSKQDREGLINDAFLKDEITEEQYIQEIKLIDDDYEPTEDELLSFFGTKWHDGL
tara:strand:- start:177 stop:344 length:168 start_codon:yes stop_codon:yes gene_type:complete